jgi:glycosyltransferase involved in cell wall biosynthesis
VVVVTPHWSNGPRPVATVIETSYQDALEKWKTRLGLDPHQTLHAQLNLSVATQPRSKRLHTHVIDRITSLLAYPDLTMGWVPFAIDAIRKIKGPINAILSTAPPITSHVIAREARSILKCPWIADFRDLWAMNTDNPNGALFRLVDRTLEKRWMGAADALVTVSRPWAERLQESYPHKPVHVITNGFDPDDFACVSTRNPYFVISYTGQLYAGRRDPTALFEVVHELIEQGIMAREQLRIRFYGPIEAWVQPLIERCGLTGVVELHGSIDRIEALQRQQESQILLLLGWANPRETGQHTGKLFEYLGSRRPILAVGGVAGVLNEVLEETGAGVHALSKAQLRQFLIEAYAEFRERGEVRHKGNESALVKYTHQAMAQSFAELLDAQCQRHPVTLPSDWAAVSSAPRDASGG